MKQCVKAKAVAVLLLVLAVTGVASAQQGTSELRGRVVDAQGAVLPGVTVTTRNQETGMYPRNGEQRRTARSS